MSTQSATEQSAAVDQLAGAAPENEFVRVPGRTLSNGTVVLDFLIGKYLSRFNDDASVSINVEAVPTVRISYFSAAAKCLAAGLPMLTLSQSAALAHEVAEQAANWSGGAVGQGILLQGLHKGNVTGAVHGDFESGQRDERRGFVLSTGEVVFDVAGHLYTWLRDDVHGDERGLVAVKRFPKDSPVVCGAPYPSMENGVGWYPDAGSNWSGRALIRGGRWCSHADAGVFLLSYVSPVNGGSFVGVRCTKPIGL
ncbi:MAG: hypothetical protein V4508_02420 [Pseudomonadota bacterium]